jgi:hypothetical protein
MPISPLGIVSLPARATPTPATLVELRVLSVEGMSSAAMSQPCIDGHHALASQHIFAVRHRF